MERRVAVRHKEASFLERPEVLEMRSMRFRLDSGLFKAPFLFATQKSFPLRGNR